MAAAVEHPGVVLVHQFRDGAAVNTVAEAHGDAARAAARARARALAARPFAGRGAVWFSITIIIITVVEGDA